jgi:response regulator RpfG family c-di-GMP phosphodiesterase
MPVQSSSSAFMLPDPHSGESHGLIPNHHPHRHNLLQGVSLEKPLLSMASDTDLMAALSATFRQSGEVELTQYRQQHHDRIFQQVRELVQQYSFKNMVSIFGLPGQSSSLDAWMYPMIAHALRQILQCQGVHIYRKKRSASDSYHLTLAGSTALPLDESPFHVTVYPEITPTSGNDLARWMAVGHYGTRFHLEPDQLINLGHPDLHSVSCEASVRVRMNPNHHACDSLLVVTDSAKRLSNPLMQLLITKTADVLASSERLNARSYELESIIQEHEANPFDDGLDSDDWQRYRNELSQEINRYTDSQHQFLIVLTQVIEQRMEIPPGYSSRVAGLLIKMGMVLELNEKTIDSLVKAAMFMQANKVHVPEDKLRQAHPWTVEDFSVYYTSTDTAIRLLSYLYSLGDTLPYLRHMLEKWDGSGYPEKLRGNNIPLGSRLLSVASAYIAMTEQKPYRARALTTEEALAIFDEETGTKWDPMLVAVLKQVITDTQKP